MCACPIGTFFRSRRRPRAGPFRRVAAPLASAISRSSSAPAVRLDLYDYLLLRLAPCAHRLLGAPQRAGVGAGALPAQGQLTAVPDAAIAADLLKTLDVQRHLAAEIAL